MKKHQQVAQLVEAAYLASKQPFAKWMWAHHLQFVAKKAEQFAVRFGANADLAVAGAWLHDFGDVFVLRHDPLHEETSKLEAIKILQQVDFTKIEIKNIIEQVIAPHSCYENALPSTLEGQVLATADALAHLQTDFYLHFAWLNLPDDSTYPEFVLWANQKMDRDFYNKIFFEPVREEVREKYLALKKVFAIDSVAEAL